ncbi:DUF1205 domain-containing protein [Dactylosporangium vinaceum]|uniref:Nucleotide disphospho-sugar-binding domain-containing protein n=1 Tax=Dactylosporangium vinaceum TaxID=53362 RepID=A0ABV5MSV7_9ACTN|nr:nucleotide disphospho-sugar-binding domain-containing protein [Dactylosporangium vinaceum]UAB97661.1 DUF1205 domain-containing protein [Dactylosporangium vinaceum]
MRVLFMPMAQTTHYHQLVGLLWAFRAAGHDVRVIAQPGVLDAVTATGVIAVAAGGGYDIMEGAAEIVRAGADTVRRYPPGQMPPEARARLFQLRLVPHIRGAEDMAADVAAFAEGWRPDLVVADPLVYAAPIAAAVAGVPLVRHLWGPDMSRHIGLPGTGVDEAVDPRGAWPDELIALYGRYGAKPAADVAARTVDTTPQSLQLPGVPNRIATRYTSYNGASIAPARPAEPPPAEGGRSRVCVTWGSSSTALIGPQAFAVPKILQALRGLDLDVVVAVRPGDRERVGEVPSGVRVICGVPLDLVLPGCDAVIHQSGAGTTLTAAFYGVPQVTIPQVADQFMVSERLSATRAGVGLTGEAAGIEGIRAATQEILGAPAAAIAADRLRAEMHAQPAPAAIVPQLVELAERRSF